MTICHFCDDKKSKTVCKNCFNEMIYRTEVIKEYGLDETHLKDIFCISFENRRYNRIICYKYHKDDLDKLLNKIIKSLPDSNKQKKKLIEKQRKRQEKFDKYKKLNDKKNKIEEYINIALKKLDQKYVNNYTTCIERLIEEYLESTSSISDIVFGICSEINKRIEYEKNEEQKILNIKKLKKNIDKIIKTNSKYKKYSKYIIENSYYDDYINSIINLEQFHEYTKSIIQKHEKLDKLIDKKIKEKVYNTYAKDSYIYQRVFYIDKYEPEHNDLNYIFEKIREYVNEKKNDDNKKNKEVELIDIIQKKYSKYSEYIENKKIYNDFINSKISTKEFDTHMKLLINRETKIYKLIEKKIEKKYIEISKNSYIVKEFIEFNSEEINDIIEKVIELITIYKEHEHDNENIINLDINDQQQYKLILKYNNKYMNDNNYKSFTSNNPPGSGDLDSSEKRLISASLYDFNLNPNKQYIKIPRINLEYIFFVDNKCDILKLKTIKIKKDEHNITYIIMK